MYIDRSYANVAALTQSNTRDARTCILHLGGLSLAESTCGLLSVHINQSSGQPDAKRDERTHRSASVKVENPLRELIQLV
jgi:hypothetical protein